ncbi:MAG: type II toxin-antitoxin system RelE/ParE family toxin [Alphaproteobacteria bacterium]|nr:type II toxin-antitoxin system RelE/ParE family toxin [Alphaproteobacteria bacterium]
MTYRVEFAPAAKRAFDQLDPAVRKRIAFRLVALEEQPLPPGAIKLAGKDSLYRIRVGDWRIVYEIDHGRVLVLVLKIGHRREVYR